jgi:purine nucleosidase/pyrimidine-specific ribonucleoside hydrolase
MTVPLILDCDPGHDDAFAILLAAGDPTADLRAITTVGGNGNLDAVTNNALRVCTLAGIMDVPVAAGAAAPLHGALETAADVHGESGLDGPDLPDPAFELDPRSAHELMVDVLTSASEPVTLVPTGPITNIATLLRDAPELKPQIREIVWMGGSAERGNRTPYAEFNAWVDPDALEIVLAAGVRFTMVGLHVTHQALATPQVIDRIGQVGTPLARTCQEWLHFFAGTYRELFGMEPPLHDPCAMAIALDPTIAEIVDTFVAAETQGRWTRGATVVDLKDRLRQPPNARVAMSIDVERFWARMIAAIAALAA